MRLARIITAYVLVCILFFDFHFPALVYAADDTPYFVVGDGSGGGGAGGNQGMSGAPGGGGDDTLDYSNHTATLVIFGDGSGGGGGGRGVGYTNNVVVGGAGGGGADVITGGSGNDVIFGDGFHGKDTTAGVFYPGRGGLGGGGGGAAGGGFGGPPAGAAPGLCGGGGGGGTVSGGTNNLLVACGNSSKGSSASGSSNGGNGGNAATPEVGNQGLGGSYFSTHGGGGGGFGGAAGGSGVTVPQSGGTSQYRVVDTGSVIHSYFTESVLRSVLTNYPNYGSGNDTINGKGGNNELFGLGGNDNFIVDSTDAATRVRIWDFSGGDTVTLKTNGIVIATVDINSYVGGATVGDYDGDGSDDDSRILFEGVPIDIIGVTSITSDDSGSIGTPNNIPILSMASNALPYSVSSSATPIDSALTVSDADGDSDWNGGTMIAQIIANSTGSDTISVSGTSIEVTGTVLKYSGASIGTLSASGGSVSGNNILTITFNSGATNSIVQTILRNVRFYTSSSGTADRVVQLTVSDKAGASVQDSREIDVSGAGAITYFTVSANAGTGGSITPASRQIASGATGAFTVTAQAGYTVNMVSGCGGALSEQTYTTVTVSSDCSITATFTANTYSISFDSQGGDAVSSISQAYSTFVSLPSASKSGFALTSWNTRSDGTGTGYTAGQSISMPVNGLTLYAQWGTAPTPTPSASPTNTPVPGSVAGTSSSAGSVSNTSCSAAKPAGVPDLFQIDVEINQVTLYFTPVQRNTMYYISYSTGPSAEQHGVEMSLSGEGVQKYSINGLSPGTVYYFKVRGQNGCMPGDWSNIKSAKTQSFLSGATERVREVIPDNTIDIVSQELTHEKSSICSYEVVYGDTLWSIATSKLSSGVRYKDILKINKLSGTSLFVGQVLKIPCDAKQETITKAKKEAKQQGVSLDILVQNSSDVPLAGVTVTLHSKVQIAQTDTRGIAHFENVEPGDHRIILTYKDYTGEQSLTVNGQHKEQKLTLKVEMNSGFSSPYVIAALSALSGIILFLLFIIFKKRSKRS